MGRLGIDRTFNLGPFFVTTLVYKNHRLIKKETKDHPLFLGPIFLHQDSSYRSYRRFFYYISAALDTPVGVDVDLRISPLMEFGSDDEKALTKAFEASFPLSERVLCTKHLKDNLKHYMTDVAAVKPDDRVIISEMIFGEKGLVNIKVRFIVTIITL
ncbi:unnamed protein product [Mytilus coruscus]|uniref:MULE transposase domain-containing protein n=1 Tax=Mytilus coruscus TaxID=42192 RepID=A0A6J8C245_MYTCO|nr:unnamed protein product [Mytilus coruscus]